MTSLVIYVLSPNYFAGELSDLICNDVIIVLIQFKKVMVLIQFI